MEEDKKLSQYNEAGFQIQRLHNIWLDTRLAREKGNLKQVRWKLDSAEVELSEDIDEHDEGKKDEEKFSKKLEKINENIGTTSKEKEITNFYINLMKKEKLLRKIQNKAGKGAKYRDLWDEGMD